MERRYWCFIVVLLFIKCSIPTTSPPRLTAWPAMEEFFKETEDVRLACISEANPQPTYYWERNGEFFDEGAQMGRVARIDGQGGTIKIKDPNTLYEGFYQCFATNSFGTAASPKIALQAATLKSFPQRDPFHLTVSPGSSVKLDCIPPVSYPVKHTTVNWVIHRKNVGIRPIQLTERIGLDYEGNLWFSAIEQEDGQPGDTYQCQVYNSYMRMTAYGFDTVLDVKSSSQVKSKVKLLYNSPTETTFLVGSQARFICIFSGNPTPRVYWYKCSTRLDTSHFKRIQFHQFGKELTINNLTLEDAGQYKCEGLNEETSQPVQQPFILTVNSRPMWVSSEDMPHDTIAAVGETVVFDCNAYGVPQPTITWYINGKEWQGGSTDIGSYAIDLQRIVVETRPRNRMIIQHIIKESTMVVQCNASNKNGWLFKNAMLNVLSVAPEWVQMPPDTLKVAEGKTAVITCRVFGAPKPKITWRKDGEVISGGHYTILKNGDLEIRSANQVDAGIYTCDAENVVEGVKRFVSPTGRCKLIVRRPTEIVQPPMGTQNFIWKDVKLTCAAKTDILEQQHLSITWKKDWVPIDYELLQRFYHNQLDNTLVISGAIPQDTGTYTCSACNGLDCADASAQLLIRGWPDPPFNLYVRVCTQKVAVLRWSPGKDNQAQLTNFIIQYNTTFAPQDWITAAVVPPLMTEWNISLAPWNNYTFRIVAVNYVSESVPSVPSSICYTRDNTPSNNPGDVRSLDEGSDRLVIGWKPVQPMDQAGPQFAYNIFFVDAVAFMQGLYPQEKSAVVQKWDEHRYITQETISESYTAFYIKVQSGNGNGLAPDPDWKIGFSGENPPTIAPMNLKLLEARSDHVKIQWEEVALSRAEIRGYFRGYQIEYFPKCTGGRTSGCGETYMKKIKIIVTNPEDELKPWFDDNGNRWKPDPNRPSGWTPYDERPPGVQDPGVPYTHTIYNLQPNMQYEFTVKVINKHYAGPPSSALQVTTPQGAPGPVGDLRVLRVGPDHVILNWQRPKQPNGRLTGYQLGYRRITGLHLDEVRFQQPLVPAYFENQPGQVLPPGFSVNEPLPEVTAEVKGLVPNNDYRLMVWALTEDGRGDSNFADASTPMHGHPAKPTVRITDVYDTAVNISWIAGTGPIESSVHYVEYRRIGAADWSTTSQTTNNHMFLEKLEGGVTYDIRVVAQSGEYRSFSDIKLVTPTGYSSVFGHSVAGSAWLWLCIVGFLILIALLVVACIFRRNSQGKKAEQFGGYAPGKPGGPQYGYAYGTAPPGGYGGTIGSGGSLQPQPILPEGSEDGLQTKPTGPSGMSTFV